MRLSCDSILSKVQDKAQGRVSLMEMLETLDRAKPALFESLRKHFAFPIEAKALTQKILNLCLAKYHFLSRSTVVLSRPFGLVIDPSNSCNLACPGCVHSQQVKALKLFEWNPGLLAETRVGAFLKSYGPNATHAILCNYGEPLINPDTPKFARVAKSYLIQTWLSTNMSVPRFDADAYVESGLDFMVLSIDGATQPVYERFRRKGKLELVFENIRKLVEAKRRLGRPMPIVQWRFLAFEHNVHEIPLAMEKARELGVDQFAAAPAWDVSWDDPNIRPADNPTLYRKVSVRITARPQSRIGTRFPATLLNPNWSVNSPSGGPIKSTRFRPQKAHPDRARPASTFTRASQSTPAGESFPAVARRRRIGI